MKTLRLRKGFQATVLGLYTAGLLALTLLVQGRPGVRTNLEPFTDLKRMAARASRGDVLSNSFVYAVAGALGNLAMFAIWGFLAWKYLDAPARSPVRTTLEVLVVGLLFSLGIETVQFFLPTRAADVNDVFWNALGTIAGAATALLGRYVEVEWE